MTINCRIKLYWRHVSLSEFFLILLPFTLIVPKLVPYIPLGHDGEISREFLVSGYLLLSVVIISFEKNQKKIAVGIKNIVLIGSVGLFVIWSGFSVIWSWNAGMAIDHTISWFCYFTLLLTSLIVLRERSKLLLVASLEVVVLIISILKLFQYWVTEGERVADSPLYSNLGVESEILVTVLPLIIINQFYCRRKSVWFFNLITSGLCIMANLSTYQRTPALALLSALLILTILLAVSTINVRSKIRIVSFLFVLTVSSVVQVSLGTNAEGLAGTTLWKKKLENTTALNASGGGERLMLWDAAIKMLENNLILGVGAGNYKSKYSFYRKQANRVPFFSGITEALSKGGNQSDGSEVVYRTHNEFLQIAAELGVIGIIIILSILISIVYLIINNIATSVNKAVLAGIIGFLVSSSLSSFSFRWIPCGLIFFLIITLTLNKSDLTYNLNIRFSKKYIIILIGALLLAFFRTTQVICSQYFESKVDSIVITETNLPKIKEDYRKIIWLDPYNYTARYKEGVMLFRQKHYSEAIVYLESSVDREVQGIIPYIYLAEAYKEVSNLDQAASVLQEGIKLTPSSVVLKVVYSDILYSNGKLQLANQQINTALSIDSTYTKVFASFWSKGLVEAALESKRKGILPPQQLGPSSVMQPLRSLRHHRGSVEMLPR